MKRKYRLWKGKKKKGWVFWPEKEKRGLNWRENQAKSKRNGI